MADFYPVPFKRSDQLEWSKALRKFVQANYKKEFAEVESHLQAFHDLRHDIRILPERQETSLQLLQRYLGLLNHAQSHFPLEATASQSSPEIKLSYCWSDAFVNKKFTVSHVDYERASVLFNIAAAHTQIAAYDNRSATGGVEGLKSSCTRFQQAAGIFQHIRDDVLPRLSQANYDRRPLDLSKESLTMFIDMCLANAQQLYYELALQNKMKPALAARLSSQASRHYHEAYSQMNTPAFMEHYERPMSAYLKFCTYFFEARATYHMSQECKESEKVGEEIGWLNRTLDLLEEARSTLRSLSPSFSEMHSNFYAEIRRRHDVANNENDKVFHERVPTSASLPVIEPRPMAKPAPFSVAAATADVPDPFVSLIPIFVKRACETFQEKSTVMVVELQRSGREKSEAMKAKLGAMNLPGAILAAEQHKGMPNTVKEKLTRVQEAGGMKALNDVAANLKKTRDSARSLCAQIEKALNDEESDDVACRTQFGSRWARVPSSELNRQHKEFVRSYRSKLEMADRSDQSVDAKLEQFQSQIEVACQPVATLERQFPPNDISAGGEALGKAFSDLKSLLAQVETEQSAIDECLKAVSEARDKAALSSSSPSPASASLSSSSASPSTPPSSPPIVLPKQLLDMFSRLTVSSDGDTAVTQELQKLLGPMAQDLQKRLQHMDELMTQVEEANKAFVAGKKANASISKSEELMSDIFVGVNKFEEVMANMREGQTFYASIETILQRMKEQSLDDFLFARKEEKAQLIEAVSQRAVSSSMPHMSSPMSSPMSPYSANPGLSQGPSAPIYHQQIQPPNIPRH